MFSASQNEISSMLSAHHAHNAQAHLEPPLPPQ